MSNPYLLLTPGPLSTTDTVKATMMEDFCTWDKSYNEEIVTKIRQKLIDIAGVSPEKYTTILLQGSGTYCVEAAIGASVKSTDKLLILANGAYGDRMKTIADYYQLNAVCYSIPENNVVDGEVARKALSEHPDVTHLSVVHSETTTGILNQIQEIGEAIAGKGITYIVDAMSSFGGVEIDIDRWEIDFLISSANKCIQGVPGFGFIIARRESLLACEGVARSLSLDIYDQWKTMEQGGGKWRFTSPTHVVRAFAQALKEFDEEGGVVARNHRYTANQALLSKGMKALGFDSYINQTYQSPIITSFLYPSDEFNFDSFYEFLKAKGFVIYPGKISQGKAFRIGTIGDVHPYDIEQLLNAIAEYDSLIE